MQHIAHRICDILISGLLLVLTGPLFALIVLAIKIESPGRAFSSENRWDRRGFRVEVLKFRTEKRAETASGMRIMRVGQLLRYTHIDSLPQLVNVLRGELTIVGADRLRPDFLELG